MMLASDPPIVVHCELNASVDVVWDALTELGQMQNWYFAELDTFEPVVGFQTEFDVEAEGQVYRHLWEVIESVPNEIIAYLWKYGDIPGEGRVTFRLESIENGTRLELVNEVLKDFESEDAVFTRESCKAGWEYLLNERLAAHLA